MANRLQIADTYLKGEPFKHPFCLRSKDGALWMQMETSDTLSDMNAGLEKLQESIQLSICITLMVRAARGRLSNTGPA